MSSITRRDFLRLAGAGLFAAALPRQGRAAAAPQAAPILYHGSNRWPRISLTYDDCQLVTRLHMLQEILVNNPEARVTLFPVGQALLNNESKDPGIWKWFHTRGHEFGYHGWDHTDPWVLSEAEMLADFDRWQEALHQVLGAPLSVQFARPPYGNLSDSFLSMCAIRAKVATMWSTGFGGPVEVGVNAAKRARYGDIALLHTRDQGAIPQIQQEESWDLTISAQVLPYFSAQGIECVTLSTLYDDMLREQHNRAGCDVGKGQSLTRTCLD